MTNSIRDRVFLSYAHEDLKIVRKIFQGLKQRDLEVWFDKENLGVGKWKNKITKAIARSRYFVICISDSALRKTGDEPGFQDEELNTAYEIAKDQAGNEFTIIPVRLEDCGRGDHRISIFNQYDLFNDFENSLDRLALALGGHSLFDIKSKDERNDENKTVDHLIGEVNTANFAMEYEKSIQLCNAILLISHDDLMKYNTLIEKAYCLIDMGCANESLQYFDEAININKDSTGAWNEKGLALCDMGRYEESLEACNKTIKIDKDHYVGWQNKARALFHLGRYEESLETCNKAIDIKEDYILAWQSKIAALFALGRYKESLEACNRAIDINKVYIIPWTFKALTLKRLGRYDEALESYNSAIKIDVGRPYNSNASFFMAWNNKGYLLHDLGHYEEAIECYHKAIEISKNNSVAQFNKGRALYALGRYEETLKICIKILKKGSNDIDVYYLMKDSERKLGIRLYP